MTKQLPKYIACYSLIPDINMFKITILKNGERMSEFTMHKRDNKLRIKYDSEHNYLELIETEDNKLVQKMYWVEN